VDTWDPAHPVAALVERSRTVDLVVVGSRGLHGVRALGSVSERVAHEAHCTVLVVQDAIAGGGA
jgi:nucleotide-binding universal stress UspA family protein